MSYVSIPQYLTWLARDASQLVNIFGKSVDGTTFGKTLSVENAIEYIAGRGEWYSAIWASIHQVNSIPSNEKISKGNIERYRYLAIDIDSKVAHQRGVCSTDDERDKTLVKANEISAKLQGYGFPIPLKVMSGNGALLLFPIDLPNNDDNHTLLASFATYLARLYNDDNCDIDKAVIKDPSRILGVVGTFNRSKVEVPTEGRQAKVREVIGDYPPNIPMNEADFIAAVKAMMTVNSSQNIMADTAEVGEGEASQWDKVANGSDCNSGASDKVRRCIAYLNKVDDAVSGQGGHEKTFRAAKECVRFGLTMDEAGQVMSWFNETKCQPTWTDAELAHKIKSAYDDLSDEGVRVGEVQSRPSKVDGEVVEFPMTDLGNAEHFSAVNGENLKYVVQWKSWLIWDGRRWARDNQAKVRRLGMKFVRNGMLDYAKGIKDDDRRAKYLKWASISQSEGKIDSMLSLASSIMACSTEQLDANGNLFNVANGTIELDTLTFRCHNRKDLLTKISEVEFNKAAGAPTWDKFLDRIFQDEMGRPRGEMVEYVQRAVGYSMTADVSAQVMFILYGNGRNGKTTFMDAIKLVMGEYAMTGLQSLLLKIGNNFKTNSDDEAALFGKRFVAVSETDEGQRFDESKIKRLVGGGDITAMRKFEQQFTFAPSHKLWLDCNHLPKVKGVDEGIWRRLKKIGFKVQIPYDERDEHLGDKLAGEASGILNWMLNGLSAWLADGRKLREPAEVSQAGIEYQTESDEFGSFLSDCIVNNDAARVSNADAYNAYYRWADGMGIKMPLNKIEFGKKMVGRRFSIKMSHGVRYIVGCSLATEQAKEEMIGVEEDDRAF